MRQKIVLKTRTIPKVVMWPNGATFGRDMRGLVENNYLPTSR